MFESDTQLCHNMIKLSVPGYKYPYPEDGKVNHDT